MPTIDSFDSFINAINSFEGWATQFTPGEVHLALMAFGVYLLLILGGGLLAVLARSLVRALMGLVVTFLGVAGMYLLLASPFMAFMQLLIYIGAVCVLVFFAIMLTKNSPATGDEYRLPNPFNLLYGLGAAAAPMVVLAPVIFLAGGKLPASQPVETETAELGLGLLTNYVLSFELISVILLAAMAGGVLLAWEKRGKNK